MSNFVSGSEANDIFSADPAPTLPLSQENGHFHGNEAHNTNFGIISKTETGLFSSHFSEVIPHQVTEEFLLANGYSKILNCFKNSVRSMTLESTNEGSKWDTSGCDTFFLDREYVALDIEENPAQKSAWNLIPDVHNTCECTKVANPSKTKPPPSQRSSKYRGVTKHRWTGRYEAHLWDNSSRKAGQKKKGRQVYLGGYISEEDAGRAYDLAALKYWGPGTVLNFPLSNYTEELVEMDKISRQEYIATIRRKSNGFSRGASKYRGVTRHHQHGRWEARIGRVLGNKYLYLGTYATQEEAAEAYDIAAVKYRGLSAVTNFDLSRYIGDERIMTDKSTKFTDQAEKGKGDKSLLESVQDDISFSLPSWTVADCERKVMACPAEQSRCESFTGSKLPLDAEHLPVFAVWDIKPNK